MSANTDMIRRFVDVVKNGRKLDQIPTFFRSDYVERNETVRSFGPGTEGYKNFLGHLFEAFPDDTVVVDEILGEGELVAYRATESGTHKATFLGIPATGKKATWTEIQFFRVRDGKIVERWVDVDLFSWFTQLGVIPKMGG